MTVICKRVPLVLGLLLGLFFCQPAWAAENEITVTPQQVDNQRVTTSEVSLPLDGKTHQLTMSVTNFSNQEQTLNYQGAQAMTDSQGQLTYGTPASFAGEVPVQFAELIPKASLTLAAGETKEVTVPLELPQVAEGESLGGIQMTSEVGAYSLPVSLEGVTGVPDPDVAVTEIAGELVDDVPAFTIIIANRAAVLWPAQPVNLTVVHSYFFGLVKTTWQVDLAQVSLAPNGEFRYPVSMNGQALKSGHYQITGTIGQGDNQVKVDKAFTLSRAEAAAINKQAPNVTDATLRRGIPVLIGLTVILILVITVAIRQNRKNARK